MPMVGHDAVRKKCDLHSADGIFKEPLEGGVVTGFVKKNSTFSRAIKDVEHKSRRALATSSNHGHLGKAIAVPKRSVL